MKFLLIILWPLVAFGTQEIEDAKRSIHSLIYPLLQTPTAKTPHKKEDFRVDGCEKKKLNWQNILLMRETAQLDFKFKEGCDIQGTIRPRIFQTFPAELELRNISSYSNIISQNRITADLQAKPILNLEMRDGLLTGKKSKVKFEADYKIQMNPIAGNPVEKNLGGELRIVEINGKKTLIKEKILVR